MMMDPKIVVLDDASSITNFYTVRTSEELGEVFIPEDYYSFIIIVIPDDYQNDRIMTVNFTDLLNTSPWATTSRTMEHNIAKDEISKSQACENIKQVVAHHKKVRPKGKQSSRSFFP
jgi:hypothetical protein